MRAISLDAAPVASRQNSAGAKSIDTMAEALIKAGYIYDDHYLEMKHLDPKWLVALTVYATALYKALGGTPNPRSPVDR